MVDVGNSERYCLTVLNFWIYSNEVKFAGNCGDKLVAAILNCCVLNLRCPGPLPAVARLGCRAHC